MKNFLIISTIVCQVFTTVIIATNSVMADDETELDFEIPELYIRAVNPGYVIDGKNNVGEMIEIARKNSDAPISLAGATVGYTNSSGKYSTILVFPENSWMTGESILLRLASSPMSELAAMTYKKTLAMKGELDIRWDDEVVDSVCWTGKTDCYKEFKSGNPTTLVRNMENGEFEHLDGYEPVYDENSFYIEMTEEEDVTKLPSQCKGIIFSEILSYYETSQREQFIELYNTKSEQIQLDGCKLKYKNKFYSLSGAVKPESYFVYYPVGFRLTKNPTNSNKLEIIDINEAVVDMLEYPNGQRKGTSYALIGYDKKGKEIWKVTYAPTPGEPNNYQEFKTCESGKIINKETGNCVKITEVKPKICKEGYYLNVLTGRCRKKQTAKEKVCKEGYYLNPETNRCRKIKENNGANYSLEPETYEEQSSFVALYAVLGVLGLGFIYLIYEFRHGILKFFGKVFRRFH